MAAMRCGTNEVEAVRGDECSELRGVVPVELREAGCADVVAVFAPEVAAVRCGGGRARVRPGRTRSRAPRHGC
jgi:hypothetical protein